MRKGKKKRSISIALIQTEYPHKKYQYHPSTRKNSNQSFGSIDATMQYRFHVQPILPFSCNLFYSFSFCLFCFGLFSIVYIVIDFDWNQWQ